MNVMNVELRLNDPVTVKALGRRPQLQGFVAYLGKNDNTVGVRLTGPSVGLGDHNGSLGGMQYFSCPPNCGILTRVSQVQLRELTLADKLRINRQGNEAYPVSPKSPDAKGSVISMNSSGDMSLYSDPDEEAFEVKREVTKKSKSTSFDDEEIPEPLSVIPKKKTEKKKEEIPTWKKHMLLVKEYPQNLILAIFLFFVLVASGVAICSVFAKSIGETMKQDAIALAEETGLIFSKSLDEAILPLFSLAQFVNELDIFKDLPKEVGLAGEEGSLPFMPPKVEGGPYTHRNYTGVCDRQELVERFDKIAAGIKKNAGMEGVLVNLQLVPNAVVCLAYPLNNTEDFPEGVFMDNSGAIGHDLLTDPARKFIAEATVPSEEVVIAGPLKLKQCQDCDPTVEKAFIARLPIADNDNTIVVDDVSYQKWGFAVALINWNAVLEKSKVFEDFKHSGMEFSLTRTDRKYIEETDTYDVKVVTLAQSDLFANVTAREESVILPTTNNDWEMTVKYCVNGCNNWYVPVVASIVVLSLFIAGLVYTIFSQNQLHNNALAEKQAQLVASARKAARNERELNDFIAHEVRNPLAAALSACSFVSTTVNEKQPLKDEESKISVREDVHIMESSLQFINDLLRSMLDLHRARSAQLSLEFVPTDIKRDILDPVASMLYHRDSMFEVQVICPDNLIVSVDRLRLKQIVLNLARNSSKFVEAGFVRLRAQTTDDGIIIYVEDSGPGIPEDKREKLFARFQDSLDELQQGTGIGLSLCKKLVDLMEGSITLDDSYHSGLAGKPGAKLDIKIKCDIINIEELSLTEEESEVSLPMQTFDEEAPLVKNIEKFGEVTELPDSLKTLFVDDDVVLRKLFSRALKRIRPNWIVHEAASGESALVMVESESEPYDIIFMDQYMTSVDKQLLGTETIRALRAKGIDCNICGLSANDMEEPFKSAGADTFMIKPFPCKPEPLTIELLRVLNKKEFVY